MIQNRVLLVGCDANLIDAIGERLEADGHSVQHCSNGQEACIRILSELPDLVVLDTGAPGTDGFAICRDVRPDFRNPIVVLTARDDDVDQILALELGADDYIVKPVRPEVLVARIRALLRRLHIAAELRHTSPVILGALRVDPSRREASLSGRGLDLTTVEFDLLWLLVSNAGCVMSRDDIFRALHKRAYDGLDRSIDVYISRIRQKLDDDPTYPRFIKTVRGVGYLLASQKGSDA